LPLIRATGRRIPPAGVLLGAAGVAYFYVLDRSWLSTAHFSPIYRLLLTVYDSRTAWLAFAICCFAVVWKDPVPISRWVDFAGNNPRGLALASAGLIAFGAVGVYRDYPLSMDEYAAVFQARIFASGQIFAQLPRNLIDWLVVSGFNGAFLVASPETGRAIESYWPGFSLLLAPFEFSRVPWLCNATLAGCAVYLVFWITHEITGDRRAAGWAMLFTVASGGFIANGMSYYSMQAHLTANLLFVALMLKPSRFRALGAGLVGSLALLLHNPVPHALFALPWIVATAMERDQRPYLPHLLLGYLPGLALGLGWLVFRSDIGGAQGLSAVRGVADGVFTLPDATVLNMRAAALVKVWIWSVPCLFLFAALGCRRHWGNRSVRLLAESAALTFVAYLFVRFDQGHGWGYRYFHPAWGALPILAGCAMAARSDTLADSRLISFAGAAAILNLVLVVPFQVNQIGKFISGHLAQLPPPQRPGNNVYFIHPRGGFYVADMVQMDPLLRNADLFLVSHGASMDGQFVRQNWPSAIKMPGARAADQWYLGPQDLRTPLPGSGAEWHFASAPGGTSD
jgi:hypothetical protein